MLPGAETQGLLNKFRGVATVGAREALGLDLRAALRVDGDLNRLYAPPPTWTVSLIEPSVRACSVTA
jgi:hypothetical protein